MCVSLGPARFSNTILYAAQVEVEGKLRHVLGYQNTVQNLPGEPPPTLGGPALRGRSNPLRQGTGNAMILPFPAAAGSMTQENVLDTSSCRNILKNMAAANPFRSRSLTLGNSDAMAKGIVVFENDIYTTVLASDSELITDRRLMADVLAQVPEEKRPAHNTALFEAYAQWYQRKPIALCCFSNEDEANAAPMLWWYEPLDETELFAPALDSHTGEVPSLDATVHRDHTVIFSVPGIESSPAVGKVHYSDTIPDAVRPYLATHVNVNIMNDEDDPNGDFVVNVATLRSRSPRLKSVVPPGAGKRPPITKNL